MSDNMHACMIPIPSYDFRNRDRDHRKADADADADTDTDTPTSQSIYPPVRLPKRKVIAELLICLMVRHPMEMSVGVKKDKIPSQRYGEDMAIHNRAESKPGEYAIHRTAKRQEYREEGVKQYIRLMSYLSLSSTRYVKIQSEHFRNGILSTRES